MPPFITPELIRACGVPLAPLEWGSPNKKGTKTVDQATLAYKVCEARDHHPNPTAPKEH